MAAFFQDLLDMFRSRIKNVLYSTFVISWIIVNWKFFFILLFSDDNPKSILQDFDSYYSFWEKWIYFLAIPIALSFFHIFLFSRVSEFVYKYWLEHIKRLSDAKRETEGSMLLTVEEGQKIRAKNARLKVKIDKLEKEHIQEISSLMAEGEKRDQTRAEHDRLHKHIENEPGMVMRSPLKKNKNAEEKTKIPSKPKISDVLDGLVRSEWNVLSSKDCDGVSKVHAEGGEEYDISRMIDEHDYQKIKNFNNISKPKGITLETEYISYTQERTLNRIKWDRTKFQN